MKMGPSAKKNIEKIRPSMKKRRESESDYEKRRENESDYEKTA